jgi:hypothetical protein
MGNNLNKNLINITAALNFLIISLFFQVNFKKIIITISVIQLIFYLNKEFKQNTIRQK